MKTGKTYEERIAKEIIENKTKISNRPERMLVPKDKAFLCHCLFFLLGICHFVPVTFTSASNNFWLYKFRNIILAEDSTAKNRSPLQINYSSSILIISTVTSLVSGIFNLTFSRRFNAMNRLYFALTTGFFIFITYTISAYLQTDKFQFGYFIYVLLSYGCLSAANFFNIVASFTLFPRFPSEYTHSCLIGQATIGVLGDSLNVLSIWVFKNDTIKGTFLYFILGSSVFALAIILLFRVSRMDFFTENVNSMLPSSRFSKKVPSFKEIRTALRKTSYAIFIMWFYLITTVLTHASVATLVVSEEVEIDSIWAKNYFSPVMSFLLADVFALLGRSLIAIFPFEVPNAICIPFLILRTVILIPMVWFCNAQPRHYLPLLFPHDYQYGLILAALMLTNGMILSYSVLIVPKKLEPHEVDLGFIVFYFSITVLTALFSPFSIMIVNIL